MGVGNFAGNFHFFEASVGFTIAEVFGNGVGKEVALLHD